MSPTPSNGQTSTTVYSNLFTKTRPREDKYQNKFTTTIYMLFLRDGP